MNKLKVKSRPIIFNGASVRAIIDGKKTQTRRVIKPQPSNYSDCLTRHCPYGKPGELLWVRENYSPCVCDMCVKAWPKRPEPNATTLQPHQVTYEATHTGPSGYVWRPSIFMPRWASRITLEVTRVDAERVQDISFNDIKAEMGTENNATDVRNFMDLWNHINSKRGYGWDLNPWVWVVEFEIVDEPEVNR